MSIQSLLLYVALVSFSYAKVLPLFSDFIKAQEARNLFLNVSSAVDQYRDANCSALPATISVADIFASKGATPPLETGGWIVTFTNGWASISVDTLDVQDRATLADSYRGLVLGGVAVVPVSARSYASHNVTALNDRMTMEGSYNYVCY